MIEQLPQVFTLRQQLNDATHHAQLRTNTSARPDSAQQLLTDAHFVVRLSANHKGNAQIIQQIEHIHVSEPTVCRQEKAAAGQSAEHFVKEDPQELSLIQSHPLFQLRVVVRAPIQRDGAV